MATDDTVDGLRQLDETLEPSASGHITGIPIGWGFTCVTRGQATITPRRRRRLDFFVLPLRPDC